MREAFIPESSELVSILGMYSLLFRDVEKPPTVDTITSYPFACFIFIGSIPKPDSSFVQTLPDDLKINRKLLEEGDENKKFIQQLEKKLKGLPQAVENMYFEKASRLKSLLEREFQNAGETYKSAFAQEVYMLNYLFHIIVRGVKDGKKLDAFRALPTVVLERLQADDPDGTWRGSVRTFFENLAERISSDTGVDVTITFPPDPATVDDVEEGSSFVSSAAKGVAGLGVVALVSYAVYKRFFKKDVKATPQDF